MAEFMYECVYSTIYDIIPKEVDYLHNYDEFKNKIENVLDMPGKTFALLVKFLSQGEGKLSRRARDKEFSKLSDEEISSIEAMYAEVFQDQSE